LDDAADAFARSESASLAAPRAGMAENVARLALKLPP